MKFRIKQIDENIYIPQLKKNLFSSWYNAGLIPVLATKILLSHSELTT